MSASYHTRKQGRIATSWLPKPVVNKRKEIKKEACNGHWKYYLGQNRKRKEFAAIKKHGGGREAVMIPVARRR